jgi:hypothetical protein
MVFQIVNPTLCICRELNTTMQFRSFWQPAILVTEQCKHGMCCEQQRFHHLLGLEESTKGLFGCAISAPECGPFRPESCEHAWNRAGSWRHVWLRWPAKKSGWKLCLFLVDSPVWRRQPEPPALSLPQPVFSNPLEHRDIQQLDAHLPNRSLLQREWCHGRTWNQWHSRIHLFLLWFYSSGDLIWRTERGLNYCLIWDYEHPMMRQAFFGLPCITSCCK